SRVPEPLADSFWSTTVLTRSDIEARQVQSLPDLLVDLAGINVDNTGGLGQASAIFIRGADSDHTLLLIDGVRVGSATLGTPPVELVPLEQIDHIEVVRGPRSTLYGSDAVGGVIQIFTRHATEPGLSFGGSATDGWTAFAGDFDNNLEFTEKVTTLHLDQALTGAWHLRALAARDVDEERDLLNLTPAGVFDTTRNSASLQIDGKPGKALRLLG